MTISRDDCYWVIHCDYCPYTYESGGDNCSFQEFWEDMKDDGWECYQEDGEWQHRCPSCAEEDVIDVRTPER